MRIGVFLPLVAALSAVALSGAEAAPAKKHHSKATTVAHTGWGHSSLRYVYHAPSHGGGPGHLVSLVGDRESGIGFYPLPPHYRLSHARDRQGDAIRYAVASETGYGYYNNGEIYGDRHHHGTFNPVDGYGTPFFAGYYGPAGDPDDDRGPFGRPYQN